MKYITINIHVPVSGVVSISATVPASIVDDHGGRIGDEHLYNAAVAILKDRELTPARVVDRLSELDIDQNGFSWDTEGPSHEVPDGTVTGDPHVIAALRCS